MTDSEKLDEIERRIEVSIDTQNRLIPVIQSNMVPGALNAASIAFSHRFAFTETLRIVREVRGK